MRYFTTDPRKAVALTLVGCWLLFFLGSQRLSQQQRQADVEGRYQPMSTKGGRFRPIELKGEDYERLKDKTLVVYIYHESNEIYAKNLAFFIKNGIGKEAHPLVDYLLIVNGETRLADFSGLPTNVWLIVRENTCYDGGTVGTVLTQHPKLWMYRHYILMNSSVRGPFLPRFFPASLPWTVAFTQLITDKVKLVGTTISCQGQVHVQSMVMATDNMGLRVLYEAGALDCPPDLAHAINNYEFGSTTAIFKRGFTIDCLMKRYHGVDWSRDPNMMCNGGFNPQLDLRNDGLNVDPFEILFVKVKEFPIVTNTHMVRRYTDYYMGDDNVTSSEFALPRIQDELKAGKAALYALAKRCGAKFDADFYLSTNPDLVGAVQPENLFHHFNNNGYDEKRLYRFVADPAVVSEDPSFEEECANLRPSTIT